MVVLQLEGHLDQNFLEGQGHHPSARIELSCPEDQKEECLKSETAVDDVKRHCVVEELRSAL